MLRLTAAPAVPANANRKSPTNRQLIAKKFANPLGCASDNAITDFLLWNMILAPYSLYIPFNRSLISPITNTHNGRTEAGVP